MNFGILVNNVAELRPTQTTSMLIEQAARAGHSTYVIPIDSLQVTPDKQVRGRIRAVVAHESTQATLDALNQCAPELTDLSSLDALMIRTNPARDDRTWAHDMALECAALLEDRGVFVANRPGALRRCMSKLMLTRLPAHVLPNTLITRDVAAIEQFLRECPGEAVLKPLAGTRGQDVFRIDPAREANLRQICNVLTRDGYCMAQHFVPEAVNGDVRLVMLDGHPLHVGDKVAAVRRVPGKSDFRSNIAVGGSAQPVIVTDAMREIAAAIGPQLAANGLWLIGLDLIGTTVVEVNVFSTGGLNHAEKFYGVSFCQVIINWLETRVTTST